VLPPGGRGAIIPPQCPTPTSSPRPAPNSTASERVSPVVAQPARCNGRRVPDGGQRLRPQRPTSSRRAASCRWPAARIKSNRKTNEMRLIYEKGRTVGPDPIGHYVYLWRDGDTDKYVGQGVAYRWQHHLKRGDPYFLARGADMSCSILHEKLSVVEAGRLETHEIRCRTGSGTLLNKTGGSIVEPRKVRANESAADRACRIAKFGSPDRCAVLRFFVYHGAGVYEEAAVSAALNMEPATLRNLLDVVEWRLSDRNNPRFPEIETIGALYLEGVRGEPGPKRAIFTTPGPRASCFWVYAYPAFLRYAAHSAGGYWARILPQASRSPRSFGLPPFAAEF
jgi:hypothetical protein